MNLNPKEFLKAIQKLSNNTPIYISGHTKPDMDSIGSCFAIANYLLKQNKRPYILLNEFDFEIANTFENKEILTSEVKEEDYNFILVDCNEKSRLKNFEKDFDNAKIKLNIDHHEDNKYEADFTYSVPDSSSTCELIYNVIKNDKKFKFTNEFAKCLYLGMMTDTNCFQRRLGTETLIIAQKLINTGINYQELIKQNFLSRTINEVQAYSYLVNNLKYDDFYYVVADKQNDIFKNLSHNSFTKKISEDLRKIEGIDIFVFLIKNGDTYTGKSMSNTSCIADKIAKLFGGGGHKKEAGFTTTLSLEEIIQTIKNYLKENKN